VLPHGPDTYHSDLKIRLVGFHGDLRYTSNIVSSKDNQ